MAEPNEPREFGSAKMPDLPEDWTFFEMVGRFHGCWILHPKTCLFSRRQAVCPPYRGNSVEAQSWANPEQGNQTMAQAEHPSWIPGQFRRGLGYDGHVNIDPQLPQLLCNYANDE